ncbi:hypothetical protein N7534_003435, partial [Penicillium rubens]
HLPQSLSVWHFSAVPHRFCTTESSITIYSSNRKSNLRNYRCSQPQRISNTPPKPVSRQPGPSEDCFAWNIKATANADAILFAFPVDQIQRILGAVEMREALKHKIIISILAQNPEH